nr:MAG TPA: hypothetical protein [Caudoviricetes sp.]
MAFRIKGPRPNEGPEYKFVHIKYYLYICNTEKEITNF